MARTVLHRWLCKCSVGIFLFIVLTEKNVFQNEMHIIVKPIIFASRAAHLLEHNTNYILKTAPYNIVRKHFNRQAAPPPPPPPPPPLLRGGAPLFFFFLLQEKKKKQFFVFSFIFFFYSSPPPGGGGGGRNIKMFQR